MVRFVKDLNKISRDDIVGKPGRLAAQIINNTLIDNDYFIWVIGNRNGNYLYTVTLDNRQRAVVGYTEFDLLKTYINRQEIKKSVLQSFGKEIFCVNISFKNLARIIGLENPMMAKSTQIPKYVIINPNAKDFFIPFDITYISYLQNENIEDIDKDLNEVETVPMEYNSRTKKFEVGEETADVSGLGGDNY